MAEITPIIHVETAGDGLDFDLLIGANRNNPLSFELRSERVSLVADLAEAKASALTISAAIDEPIEVPETVRGVTAATLRVNGPGDVSLEASVREEIEVAGNTDEGLLEISVAASDPSLSLRIDSVNEEITATIDAGRTQLTLPWTFFSDDGDEFSEESEDIDATSFFADFGGFSASILLNEEQAFTTIENVGFGDTPSTLHLDDALIAEWQFNPNDGRRVDLEFAGIAQDELPVISFAPIFDTSLFLDLSPFETEENEVPVHLQGETYSLTIDGSQPSIQPKEDGSVSVVSGQLRIATDAGSSVVVNAGQCLLESELTSGEHEFLGHFEAGACPSL